MYKDAIKQCLERFPIDPPGSLRPGEFVRIGRGQLRIMGDLREVLKTKIATRTDEHGMEHLGQGSRKSALGAKAGEPGNKAEIALEAAPALYIAGVRRTERLTNLDAVLSELAAAPIRWSMRHRIVTEVQSVEGATIVCSTKTANRLLVQYDAAAIPVSVDAHHDSDLQTMLVMRNVTGGIGFGGVRYARLFGHGIQFAQGAPAFQFRDLDPFDPDEYEDDIYDDTSEAE